MKILVFTKNWIGDILFEHPALQALKEQYPSAEIVCAGPERCREILARHPAVSQFLVFDEKKQHRSPFARIGFALRLRRMKFEKAYFFHRSRTRTFLAWLGGIPERIGYTVKKNPFLTKPVAEPENVLHHVDYFLALLEKTGAPVLGSREYRFYFSPQDEDAAQKILHGNRLTDYVCFHLGANWEPKRWPVSHFAKLADLIHRKWGFKVVLTGGPGDAPLEKEFFEKVREAQVVSLIGQTSLGQLGAIFSKALWVVSSDSGPMHIASGAGAPVAAIFGPTNPDFTGPRGTGEKIVLKYVPEGFISPWYGKELPAEGWLSHIQPEEVLAEIEKKDWASRRGEPYLISKLKTRSQRILVITLSNIGDVILTTPVMMSLATEFPDAEITVLVGPRAQSVLRGSRNIDHLIVYDKKAGLMDKIGLILRLREKPFDLVVDLRHTAIPYLIRARKKSPLVRHFHKDFPFREKHLTILKRMGINRREIPPFDFYNEEDDRSVMAKLHEQGIRAENGFILVAPIALSEVKTWKLSGFKEVLAGLLKERKEDILLIGSAADEIKAHPLVALDPHRIHNIAGLTTMREVGALISRASLLLANDSSILQMAFEMNCFCVSMFGPTNIRKSGRTGPRFRVLTVNAPCSPCEAAQCRFERQSCFEDLRPEMVLQACLELLGDYDRLRQAKNSEARV